MTRNLALERCIHSSWIFFGLALGLFFILLSQISYVSDSEVWLLTLSQKTFSPEGLVSIYYKWPFHVVTYLFTHWAATEWHTYLWARLLMSAMAIIGVIFTAKTTALVFKSPQFFWPSFCLILSTSIFFHQGFRIRADVMAFALQAFTLYYCLKLPQKNITYRSMLVVTVLNILIFCTTPKFILFLISQGIALLFLSLKLKNYRYFLLVLVSHCLPLTLFSLIVLISPLVPSLEFILRSVTSAIDFYAKTFDPTYGNPSAFSPSAFYYVIGFVKSNIVLSLMIYFWMMVAIVQVFTRFRQNSEKELLLPFHTYNLILVTAMLLHNHKLPFFVAFCLAPSLALSFCFFYDFLEKRIRKWTPLLSGGIIALLTVNSIQIYRLSTSDDSNQPQSKVVDEIEAYRKKNPQVKIYDIVGTTPRLNTIFNFVGPSEIARKQLILEKMTADSPDIILYVYKFKMLEPQITEYLSKNAIQTSPGVWLRGQFYTNSSHRIYFSRREVIDGKHYWIIPKMEGHFFNSYGTSALNVKRLDKNLKVTEGPFEFVAVPGEETGFFVSAVPPLILSFPPLQVFRFDRVI
ncbi:MAG: hypothetical protein K2Q26_11445 [Bdellovibrionales bacterium]|nr:hypothetical protein [Bdellovibrionales bacterium]